MAVDLRNRPVVTGRQAVTAVVGVAAAALAVVGVAECVQDAQEESTGLSDLRDVNSSAYYGCKPRFEELDDIVGTGPSYEELCAVVCDIRECLVGKDVDDELCIKVSRGEWRLNLEGGCDDIESACVCED